MLVISKEAIVCNNRSVRIKCNQVIICLSMCLLLINHMESNYIHCISVIPCSVGLLWLHDVITCLPPPHAHSEMPPSVNSTHPSIIQDKNPFMEVSKLEMS